MPLRVVTILGTRPEIIRLSRLIPALDAACGHLLVHTGQNHDERLSDLFFRELGVRPPDIALGIRADSFGQQVAAIIAESERVLAETRPDRVLILGDTNSGLAALVAARMGIPVVHMEAGHRCLDVRVPVEINRRVIDHCSAVQLPYTHGSADNLRREGIPEERIVVTGNPINEVLRHYAPEIAASRVHAGLGTAPGGYLLATLHRQENVDVPERLRMIAESLDLLAAEFGLPVVCSLHPRTARRLAEQGVSPVDPRVRLLPPFGFFDFVALERDARLVLTDSGTVQEECCILGVPAVTMRDVTERPETIACGSNLLAGVEPEAVLAAARAAPAPGSWTPPAEYLAGRVSETVRDLLLAG
ncbi:MAG: non-hydrolyzing UDP-N-acetylglucosamine 2-epimerase [Chloroflexota bacterium]